MWSGSAELTRSRQELKRDKGHEGKGRWKERGKLAEGKSVSPIDIFNVGSCSRSEAASCLENPPSSYENEANELRREEIPSSRKELPVSDSHPCLSLSGALIKSCGQLCNFLFFSSLLVSSSFIPSQWGNSSLYLTTLYIPRRHAFKPTTFRVGFQS